MNCYNHNNTIAVAQCQDCKKGLCNICSNQFKLIICYSCNINRIKKEKKQIYLDFLYSFGLGTILTFILIKNIDLFKLGEIKTFGYLGIFYISSSLYYGYKLISKFIPMLKIGINISSIFFIIIKFVLAIYVGVFALPIMTIKLLYRLYILSKLTLENNSIDA